MPNSKKSTARKGASRRKDSSPPLLTLSILLPVGLLVAIGVAAGLIYYNNLQERPANIKYPPRTFTGQLTSPIGPLAGASVTLSKFSDETCAELAQKELKRDPEAPADEDAARRLRACTQTIATTLADQSGKYTFAAVPAGWYKITAEWESPAVPGLALKPILKLEDSIVASVWQNGRLIQVAFRQSKPQTYLISLQTLPFYFTAVTNATIDLGWEAERKR